MQDIGFGLRKPEKGDKSFWVELEKLFDKAVTHTHNGTDSPNIDSQAQTQTAQTLPASAWVPLASGGYLQTVTVPEGITLDKNKPIFRIASGPDIYTEIYPTVTPSSITVYDVVVNDSSILLEVIYL